MSDNQGEALATEEVTTAADEAVFSSQEQGGDDSGEDSRNWEAEAREMGWVPEDEWKGDRKPSKFLDAKEFVERGENILPILRSQNARDKKEFADRLERIEKMNQETQKRLKAQHQKEVADLKAQMRQAVKAGDEATYDRLEKEHDALVKEGPEQVDEKDDAKATYDAAVSNFTKENDWYGVDDDLTAYANGWSQDLAAKNPNITLEENLRRTAAQVKKAFPQKFGQTQRGANGHAPVDGGGALPNGRTKQDPLVSKLPPEAKKQMAADIKAGLFKDEKSWAKVYFE